MAVCNTGPENPPQMGEAVAGRAHLELGPTRGGQGSADETLVEISTEKGDAEVPAPAAGTITEILAAAGDTVEVGQVLARMSTTNGAAAATTPEPEAPKAPVTNGENASPVARRVAETEGVDLASITGTGPRGRITKADVLSAKNGGAVAPAAGAEPLKGSAAMLARYMDESRSIPT